MIKQASNVLKHLRRSITADPERFAGGTALVGPLALLAVIPRRQVHLRTRSSTIKVWLPEAQSAALTESLPEGMTADVWSRGEQLPDSADEAEVV